MVALQTCVLFLMAVFGVAVVAKVGELVSPRPTAPDQVTSEARLGRRALVVAVVADTAVIIVASVMPTAGGALAGVLLVAYSVFLWRLPPDEDCGCFGYAARFNNRSAIWRNVFLAVVALVVAGLGADRALARGLYSQEPIGVAVVVVTIFFIASRALLDERSVLYVSRWRMPDQLSARR